MGAYYTRPRDPPGAGEPPSGYFGVRMSQELLDSLAGVARPANGVDPAPADAGEPDAWALARAEGVSRELSVLRALRGEAKAREDAEEERLGRMVGALRQAQRLQRSGAVPCDRERSELLKCYRGNAGNEAVACHEHAERFSACSAAAKRDADATVGEPAVGDPDRLREYFTSLKPKK